MNFNFFGKKTLAIAGLMLGVLPAIHAQKGLPSTEPTTADVHTAYPQHVDFNPSLISRLKVPAGFKVSIAASGLGKPRMMAVGDKGQLYITRRDQGDVLKLTDTNGDGTLDDMKTVVAHFTGVHGIVIHDGYLYLCATRELKRGKIQPDGMVDSLEMLIKDLPDGGQHPNRTIAFGPDGLLYITVGSTCNDCSDSNPENSTILQASADGKNRKIFARGLRNTIGIDWHSQTKELWGADNGTDWRGNDIPHEEINKIAEGKDYGFPLVYENQQVDYTREDPIGSTKKAYALTTESPALLLPAHSAPINFAFISKVSGLPAGYANDALLTLHGSWNKEKPDGYKVVRVKYANGTPVGTEDFLTGFMSIDGKTRFGRPAGLAIAANGIYISDDESGVIYWVSAK